MKVASIIDNYLASPHGNRQGLSYGELAVLLVTYIVSEADHRICCLEKWVREHQRSLEGITEWEIREKEATDDRCGDLLRTLGRTETQTQMEMSLSQHLVKAYELPTKQARSDTTSFSVYHQISEDGIEYSIEKKISYKKVYKGRGSRSENSSYRRVRQINLILNYERLSTEIESFKTLAGWRLYVTNATNKRLSLTEAVSAYKEQWQPEQGFHRFKKGRLSALPIYFRDEEKIKGLMFLLTIALRVFTLMEFVVRRQLHQSQSSLAGLYEGNPKRLTNRPTAEKMLRAFRNITLYIHRDGQREISFLNDVQQEILKFMLVPLISALSLTYLVFI